MNVVQLGTRADHHNNRYLVHYHEWDAVAGWVVYGTAMSRVGLSYKIWLSRLWQINVGWPLKVCFMLQSDQSYNDSPWHKWFVAWPACLLACMVDTTNITYTAQRDNFNDDDDDDSIVRWWLLGPEWTLASIQCSSHFPNFCFSVQPDEGSRVTMIYKFNEWV